MAEEKSPFTSHLDELRKRIIIWVVAVGVGLFGWFLFAELFGELL